VRDALSKTSISVKKGETPRQRQIERVSKYPHEKMAITSKKQDLANGIYPYSKPDLIGLPDDLTNKSKALGSR
jgi:hypothetical protein